MLAFLVALFILTFITSYSAIRATDSISYHTNDGWCKSDTEGFGEHCFGDYYGPIESLKEKSPYQALIRNYPPVAFAILKPFAIINSNFPGRASLVLYLTISLSCLAFPVLHLILRRKIETSDYPFAVAITFLSGPAITLLDRGNMLVFCIPFIYLFFYHIKFVSYASALKYGIFFTLIKPQLILLAIIFVAAKESKLFLKWIFWSILISVLSFAAFPSDVLTNMMRWIGATLDYGNSGAIGVLEPVNMSLKSSVDVAFNIFGQTAPQRFLTVLNLGIFALAVVSFINKFKTRSNTYNALLALLLPILFVGTAYHYYLAMLIIPALFLIVDHQDVGILESDSKEGLLNSKFSFRIRVLYIAIFTPIVLPWSILGIFDGRGWENISMHWLVAQWILSVVGISLFFSQDFNLLRRIKQSFQVLL
jgi:hypothetical protein